MKRTLSDWAKYQEFYDNGHSWKEVSKEFKVYNQSIRRAIVRGDLVSRTRAQSISLKMGGDGVGSTCTKCIVCNTDFQFRSSNRKGLYCSNSCQGKHKWETETLPRIIAGNASEQTIRKYWFMRDPVCSECNISEWRGKPLTLQLDHIDGNCDNNTIENTRLICPNCHSQTETFGSKNRGKWVTNRSIRDRKRTTVP